MTSTNKPGEKLTVTSRGFNASGLYHTTKGNVYGQVVPLGDHNAPGQTVFTQPKAFERPTTALPELHRTTGNMTTHMQRHGLKNRWPAWYPRSGSGCAARRCLAYLERARWPPLRAPPPLLPFGALQRRPKPPLNPPSQLREQLPAAPAAALAPGADADARSAEPHHRQPLGQALPGGLLRRGAAAGADDQPDAVDDRCARPPPAAPFSPAPPPAVALFSPLGAELTPCPPLIRRNPGRHVQERPQDGAADRPDDAALRDGARPRHVPHGHVRGAAHSHAWGRGEGGGGEGEKEQTLLAPAAPGTVACVRFSAACFVSMDHGQTEPSGGHRVVSPAPSAPSPHSRSAPL